MVAEVGEQTQAKKAAKGVLKRTPAPASADLGAPGIILTPSRPDQWHETFLFRFPTGRVARIRQVDFTFYATHHNLPNEMLVEVEQNFRLITEAVMGAMTQDQADVKIAELADRTKEDGALIKSLVDSRAFLEDYAMLAFIDPILVSDEEDITDPEKQACVKWLVSDELNHLWEWAWRPALSLRSFCEQQRQIVEFMARSQNVQHSSESVNGGGESVPDDLGNEQSDTVEPI